MQFFTSITSPEFASCAETLKAERPEIEALYYMLHQERFLEWAHSIGVSTIEGLRALVPPIPPAELRGIVAAPLEALFMWTGAHDAQQFAEHYDRHKTKQGGPARTLDFGCGCGRLARFLAAHPDFEVVGSDVNPELVEWCSRSIPGVTTTVNAATAPSPFSDGTFDFVFSLSILTHLSEQSALAWLRDFERITAPGGIILLTTHGQTAINVMKTSVPHHAMFKIGPEEIADLERELPGRGYIFRGYTQNVLDDANAGSEYGNSFVDIDYMKAHWLGDGLELAEYIPGGLRGWQDVVLLRRR